MTSDLTGQPRVPWRTRFFSANSRRRLGESEICRRVEKRGSATNTDSGVDQLHVTLFANTDRSSKGVSSASPRIGAYTASGRHRHALSAGRFTQSERNIRGGHGDLIPAGGFESHDRGRAGHDALREGHEAGLVVANTERLTGRAKVNIKALLGDVDADKEELFHDPSLRMRALAAQATVRAR